MSPIVPLDLSSVAKQTLFSQTVNRVNIGKDILEGSSDQNVKSCLAYDSLIVVFPT